MRLMGLFAVVAIAELAVFVLVEQQIGLLNSLLIAVLTAVIGSALVRRAGVSVIGDIRRKSSEGIVPGRELTHGAAVLVAGALLISPGFLTDVIGFTLLVPTVRDLIHRQVVKRLGDKVTVITGSRFETSRRRPNDGPEIIDVEGWEEQDGTDYNQVGR